MNKQEIKEGTICVTCNKPATKWLRLICIKQSSCGEKDCEDKAILEDQIDIHDPKQIIELDCPPGDPRPGDLIAEVIKGTGLELKDASGKFMGNWSWNYSDVSEEEWKRIKPVLKERIVNLYNRGSIRYGGW